MLLVRAVRATIDEQGRVVGSKLGQTLQRLDPSFDYRASGYSTFTKFIDAYPWLKVIRPWGRGDITIELTDPAVIADRGLAGPDTWAVEIDAAWSKRANRPGQPIPGPTAAADAAKVLAVTKLSASKYRTLQRLLDASDSLYKKWLRDGNTIIRQ